MEQIKLLPILLGGDLNCYGMAAAFYELGVYPSVALGRYRLGVTAHSRFVRQVIDGRMESTEGRISLIYEVFAAHPECRPILIGCTDEYSTFLIRNRHRFDARFIIPSPPPYTEKYADKAVFYREALKRGIAAPRSIVLHPGDPIPTSVPFLYPAVLKPCVSEDYWHHPFPGMRKVWFPRDRAEAVAIRQRIYEAGYRGSLLLQERIPVKDTDNYVLTVYCDRFARARAAVFGRVLLEEHTPRGLGNHAAILTAQAPPVARKLCAFLEDIGYRGFANFDLLRHPEGDNYLTLELNLRQGRSNHYMTAAGCNPASLIVLDHILGEDLPMAEYAEDILWHTLPLSLLLDRVEDTALAAHCRTLGASGRAVSALWQHADLRRNPLRRLFLLEHERRIRKRLCGGGDNA